MKRSLTIAFAFVLLALPQLSSEARADSGRFNLHLDIGVGAPLVGGAHRNSNDNRHSTDSAIGAVAFVGADYQLSAPWAIELMVGAGGFARPYPATLLDGTRFTSITLGVRLRPFDQQLGYNNEPEGNLISNLWISLAAGYHYFDQHQFGLQAALGYEWSIARPFQMGLFVRTALTFGGQHSGTDLMLVGGLSFSFELVRMGGPTDSDGDGLSDEDEARHGTSPSNPDTDGDGLSDGLEIETGTNPLERDTDGDGLNDGREDANQNGVVDPGETDPRERDTDGGGINDGEEVRMPGQDPLYAADDDTDGDGVANPYDECPGSPQGAEVDNMGCTADAAPEQVAERWTLDGVNFATGSAEIAASSEQVLQNALSILERNPEVRIEIAGHTDNQGRARSNQRLSQQRAEAVLQWLVDHGIDRSRLSARGYGHTEPIASNETEDGRRQNRRIEFRRTDS